jgi:hypothetical protein
VVRVQSDGWAKLWFEKKEVEDRGQSKLPKHRMKAENNDWDFYNAQTCGVFLLMTVEILELQ